MVKFKLEKGSLHPRGPSGALLRPCREARGTERQPAEQAEAEGTEWYRDRQLSAQSEKHREGERHQPAACLDYARRDLRVRFGNQVERPKRGHQNENAENESRHFYFSCASSFCAPRSLRADRSLSAFIPPAA